MGLELIQLFHMEVFEARSDGKWGLDNCVVSDDNTIMDDLSQKISQFGIGREECERDCRFTGFDITAGPQCMLPSAGA